MTTWQFLGEGNYNVVYCNGERKDAKKNATLVLKFPKLPFPSKKFVATWNAINPHIWPEAKVENLILEKDPNGSIILKKTADTGNLVLPWTAPFIRGTQSKDDEICNALINIFNNTGYIIYDAMVSNNFITTDDNQVVCVDIDFALKAQETLQDQNQYDVEKDYDQRMLQLVRNNQRQEWDKSFHYYSDTRPNTVKLIKSLYVLNQLEFKNVNFLKNKEYAVLQEHLAKIYDNEAIIKHLMSLNIKNVASLVGAVDNIYNSKPITQKNKLQNESVEKSIEKSVEEFVDNDKHKHSLSDVKIDHDEYFEKEKHSALADVELEEQASNADPNFVAIKKLCINELEQYMFSRTKVDIKQKKISLDILTQFTRNTRLTEQKIQAASHMITAIKHASNITELTTILDIDDNPVLTHGKHSAGFMNHIKNCNQHVEDYLVKLNNTSVYPR